MFSKSKREIRLFIVLAYMGLAAFSCEGMLMGCLFFAGQLQRQAARFKN